MAEDPCAANVPLRAILPLGTLQITVGAMRLPTPDHIEAAVTLARECVAQLALDSVPVTGPRTDSEALSVRLVGLGCRARIASGRTDHDQVSLLLAIVQDTTGRFESFFRGIRARFTAAGLVDDAARVLKDPSQEHFPDCVKLISTKHLRGDEPKRSSDPRRNAIYERIGRTVNSRLNAQNIYDKYKDHVWIDHLELETLSICELGWRDMIQDGKVIGQGYREVAAVPLPGFENSPLCTSPHGEDIVFEKPPRKHLRRLPLFLEDVDRERRRVLSSSEKS